MKINEFLSISIQLLNQSSKIINEIRQTSINHKWKGHKDPVTNADYKSQAIIIQGLKYYYPNLRIIAEEDEEKDPIIEKYIAKNDIKLTKINTNLIPQTTFQNNTLNISKATAWIDPLDSTISYLNGQYEDVTSLLGLTFEEKPIAGIICKPFNSQNQFFPKIYYGYVLGGKKEVYFLNGQELDQNDFQFNKQVYKIIKKKHSQNQQSMSDLRVAVSKDIEDTKQLDVIKSLQPSQIIECGGSGRKALLILENEADYLIYLSNKASKWDICAPEALLKCLGGYLTDIYGKEYLYDSNESDFSNSNGYVYALRSDILQKVLPKLQKFKID
ncbi:hypothetical protein IMG5_186090 [Ichthyophthirius multifiliis]|uniref:3'(2'),5'-bisphosphate nucleotidase 1 n=1 Tax=Ichthyophthirius multifiliis TaxID=5932 RepID=G0R3L0_ICHMU|nr:hypothetical protein IMG5_186090 [Ichthyophthirius multifiliis]EGR27947.1 hypothetical protein IMG5_186090 [Ichthyophthirius multifiliis]|eukprot:XP_004027292.1 hypothetical protein IMG5_186090 [Ichthyophthirius multifiliis]